MSSFLFRCSTTKTNKSRSYEMHFSISLFLNLFLHSLQAYVSSICFSPFHALYSQCASFIIIIISIIISITITITICIFTYTLSHFLEFSLPISPSLFFYLSDCNYSTHSLVGMSLSPHFSPTPIPFLSSSPPPPTPSLYLSHTEMGMGIF